MPYFYKDDPADFSDSIKDARLPGDCGTHVIHSWVSNIGRGARTKTKADDVYKGVRYFFNTHFGLGLYGEQESRKILLNLNNFIVPAKTKAALKKIGFIKVRGADYWLLDTNKEV